MTPRGTIEAVWRHPVKGMRGERAVEAEVRWSGLAGDRRYAFARGDDRSRFPWFTARVAPELLRYVPEFVDAADPHTSPVNVTTPSGRALQVDDAELCAELSELYGSTVTLVHSGRGLHDAAPLSFIGAPTIDALCLGADVPSEPRRFRNNFVVRGVDAEPFEEEAWVGQTVQIGEGPDAPQLRIDRRNERCAVITLEPQTLARTPLLLTKLGRERQTCVGVYASVVRPGLAREGAALFSV